MKGGTYTKILAKILVRGIFRVRDIRRNGAEILEIIQYGGSIGVKTDSQRSRFIAREA